MSEKFAGVILLVEDEPLVRLVVVDVLMEANFRVIEASNAEEALTVLKAGVPVDVLLSDVEMPPGPNGYALAHVVRQDWPDVEILIVSGREWSVDGDLPQGAAFLAKPVPNEAILQQVKSAAQRAQEARRARAGIASPPIADCQIIPFPKTA
ncbi:MAG TPA: response regulator [Microvirga sp.]|jgi:CheY-like chemotaxis protein|nr:response regulator [Microvirga sp.]